MTIEIPCPNCGRRPYTEFTFGGELRDVEAAGPEEDFRRVYLPSNAPDLQEERWFQRLLHNETAYQLQRRLQFAGLNAMVLPVRVLSAKSEAGAQEAGGPPQAA